MSLAVAFLGGLVSCLSPCVLPVIPVFLAQLGAPRYPYPLAGYGAAVASTAPRARAAGFLLGFGGVFVGLWISLGIGGFLLMQAVPDVRPLAGGAIILLGLATMVGWSPRLGWGRFGHASSFGGSFILGGGVAVGWTPCIGPALGAILTLAAASSSVVTGGLLLIAYALGMAIPFAAVALAISRARSLMRFLSGHARQVRLVSGGLVVVVGYLVATNAFARLAGLVPWGF